MKRSPNCKQKLRIEHAAVRELEPVALERVGGGSTTDFAVVIEEPVYLPEKPDDGYGLCC
jgi:hypothetical protein